MRDGTEKFSGRVEKSVVLIKAPMTIWCPVRADREHYNFLKITLFIFII